MSRWFRLSFLTLRAASLVLLVATVTACGSGYQVIRATETVQFEAAVWRVLPIEGLSDGAMAASFNEGLQRGLAATGQGFTFTSDAAAQVPYQLRVRLDPTQPANATVGNVLIEDPQGGVIDEIRIEVSHEANASSLDQAGEQFGRRTMHYVHNHEQHHY